MAQSSNWLYHDHRRCEALLSECQDAVEREDWRVGGQLFDELVTHLKLNILAEEKVLFPAYEAMMDVPRGLTAALRQEHDDIVRLLCDLSTVLKTKCSEHFLDSLVPFKAAMTQHHDREEDGFRAIAGHVLLGKREEISNRLKAFAAKKRPDTSKFWLFRLMDRRNRHRSDRKLRAR